LQASWEKFATLLANAKDDEIAEACKSIVNDETVKNRARVIVGRDTRASGLTLLEALFAGFKAAGADFTDYGYLTTPQLHYMVRCINTEGKGELSYGEPSEQGYYKKLATAFGQALGSKVPSDVVIVDCANGVGAPKLEALMKHLGDRISIKVVNNDYHNPHALNVEVRK
jgi:phosphoacetylglucosamine mutase